VPLRSPIGNEAKLRAEGTIQEDEEGDGRPSRRGEQISRLHLDSIQLPPARKVVAESIGEGFTERGACVELMSLGVPVPVPAEESVHGGAFFLS
jgi:hypothetical protein